jgi:hypothetical protein
LHITPKALHQSNPIQFNSIHSIQSNPPALFLLAVWLGGLCATLQHLILPFAARWPLFVVPAAPAKLFLALLREGFGNSPAKQTREADADGQYTGSH